MYFSLIFHSLQAEPSNPDILLVHLGGNDLKPSSDARELADRYYSKYAGAATVVGFTSVVCRKKPRDGKFNYFAKEVFAELAAHFNSRLKQRAEEANSVPTFFFRHDRLHRHLCGDGVHLTKKGYRRLFHSFKSAISHGQRVLKTHNDSVFFATQRTDFD